MFGEYGFDFTDFVCNCSSTPKRTDAICDRLRDKGVDVKYVSRHTLFDETYYLVQIDEDADCFLCDQAIADALGIERSWVELYNYPRRYAIKVDLLDDKYLVNGRLVFKDDFDFLKAFDGVCAEDRIATQLNNHKTFSNNKVSVYEDFVLIIDSSCSSKIIADRLNIPEDSVIDVSLESTKIKHIILVDKVREGC